MKKRDHARRDGRKGLGEKVADSFLREDMERWLCELTDFDKQVVRSYLNGFVNEQGAFIGDAAFEFIEVLTRQIFPRVRADDRGRLVAYLGARTQSEVRRCRWCESALRGAGRGRPKEFCGNKCRQRDKRHRSKARRSQSAG